MNDHPISQHFPLLDRAELARLAGDIKQNGLREAIVVYEGMILDGRNPWRACKVAGVEPKIKDYCNDTPVQDVLSWNLLRRHLTPSHRAAVAVEILPQLEAEAKRRRLATLKQFPDVENLPQREGKSRDKAGALLNVSGRHVFEAKTIQAKAPELFKEIKSGITTIPEAKRQIKREEKREAIQVAARSISADREREILSLCDIRHCSCAELFASGVEPNVVITDPSYGVRYLDTLTELADAAKDVPTCRCDGWSIISAGSDTKTLQRPYIPLDDCLSYTWRTIGPGWKTKVNSFWKPVVVFGRPTHWFGDVAKSDVNDGDKNHHPWGQSVSGMSDLVTRLTKPGQLVCDPFIGGGTTAVACLANGRRFVGCDIDKLVVSRSLDPVRTLPVNDRQLK